MLICRFLVRVEQGYAEGIYHSKIHAADVSGPRLTAGCMECCAMVCMISPLALANSQTSCMRLMDQPSLVSCKL